MCSSENSKSQRVLNVLSASRCHTEDGTPPIPILTSIPSHLRLGSTHPHFTPWMFWLPGERIFLIQPRSGAYLWPSQWWQHRAQTCLLGSICLWVVGSVSTSGLCTLMRARSWCLLRTVWSPLWLIDDTTTWEGMQWLRAWREVSVGRCCFDVVSPKVSLERQLQQFHQWTSVSPWAFILLWEPDFLYKTDFSQPPSQTAISKQTLEG